MDLQRLEQSLFRAAKAKTPLETVPYGFEKRVMRHLLTPRMIDWHAAWSRALWRAAAPCVGLMLLLGAWAYSRPEPEHSNDLASDFENTLMAEVHADSFQETSW